ncbi:VOC family protein [Dactylosporangium sp. CA-152071]|uniref:VOC family protein n=1 Tax=Dactylosporangium sp. CA-152071 TaxID=3239933 RepID=UPI003D9244C4
MQIVVDDTASAVEFYTAAFGATERYRECLLDGRIMRAELMLGPYRLTVGEPDFAEVPPPAPASAVLVLMCDDTEQALVRALAAGARPEPSAAGASVRDLAGLIWTFVARD